MFARASLAAVVVSACFFSSSSAQPEGDPVFVSSCGVRVLDPVIFSDIAPGHNWVGPPGTMVPVLVRSKSKIVRIVAEESSIASFADNHGTDLTQPPELPPKAEGAGPRVPPMRAHFDQFLIFCEDRHATIIGVSAPSVPVKGATVINAKGMIKAIIADGIEAVEIKDVPLKVGQIGTPDCQIIIKEVHEYDSNGRTRARLGLRIEGATAKRFESLEFLDAQGVPTKTQQTLDGGSTDSRRMTYIVDIPAGGLALRVHLWQNQRSVDVPFNIAATIGSSVGGGSP